MVLADSNEMLGSARDVVAQFEIERRVAERGIGLLKGGTVRLRFR